MKIAAVVVTYNRLHLLKECIQALRAQTYPLNKIIVINNSSTDGTLEWLLEQKDIDTVTQDNTGSAGGQYSGIKKAYEEGYDWIWCMDDDGIAIETTLKKLIEASNKSFTGNEIYGSLVINPNNHEQLAFKLPKIKTNIKYVDVYLKYTQKMSDITSYATEKQTYLYPGAMYFNSVLFHKSIVKKIGFPNPQLFIWGDETEYFHRSKFHGIKNYIVIDSYFYHPASDAKFINKWKRKYFVRNWVFIIKKYRNLKLLRLSYLFFKIFISFKWYLLKPFNHGVKSIFINEYHK